MQLESYFQMNSPDDIRFAGTRVPIQAVLYDFVHQSHPAEQIVATYADSLRPDQVYAAILWYLTHRDDLDAYLARWLEREQIAAAAQERDPRWATQRARLREARARTA
jgi:uncharacterized protein (DUF433 family)